MLFVVHDEDGKITQANKVFDPEGYDKRMAELGHKFVSNEKLGVISPDKYHVRFEEIKVRPQLFIIIDKTVIKCGDNDEAVLRGIPKGSRVAIHCAGLVIHSWDDFPSNELSISIPLPSVWTIYVDRWPYQTWSVAIEGVA